MRRVRPAVGGSGAGAGAGWAGEVGEYACVDLVGLAGEWRDRLDLARVGDLDHPPAARKLVGYSGLTPRITQSGQSSRVGRISKAGPDTLRWAAVEAAQQAWRPSNPWHALYADIRRRHGKPNPAKAAVARKILIAAWHILSLGEPFKPSAPRATDPVPASSSIRLAA